MNHHPRKRLGQHFLKDRLVVQKIVAAINPQQDDFIVEIGPGTGALTYPLLQSPASLCAIELDRELADGLHKKFPTLTLYQQDVLRFDFSTLPTPSMRVIGNLPYNIGSILLFQLLKYGSIINDMIFMLQKEVVERLCARSSTTNYGRLSVMCQSYYRVSPLFEIGADAFHPPPKVCSSMVRLVPVDKKDISIQDKAVHEKVVRLSFSKRRKMVGNALESLFTRSELEQIGIAPHLRPENLSISDYITLANAYTERLSPRTPDK